MGRQGFLVQKRMKYISLFTRIRVLFFGKGMLYGGWFFLVASISMYFMFVPYQDFTEFNLDAKSPKATGEITAIDKLKREGSQRYKFHYKFSIPSQAEIKGISYSGSKKYAIADKVTVIYHPKKPTYAKIQGLDGAYYSLATSLFQWIFMIICAIGTVYLFYAGFQRGKWLLNLLEKGESWEATCIEIKEEKVSEGDKFYLAVFEYIIEGEPYQISAKTTKPNKYQIASYVSILYDRQNPQNAVLKDEI